MCSSTANCRPSCPLSKVRARTRARSHTEYWVPKPTPVARRKHILTIPTPLCHRSGRPQRQAGARGCATPRREHRPRDCHGHHRRSGSRTKRGEHGKPDYGTCKLAEPVSLRCAIPARDRSPAKTNQNANPIPRSFPTQTQIPVGRATLGRIMNVIGEPIDECGPIGTVPSAPTRGFRTCVACFFHPSRVANANANIRLLPLPAFTHRNSQLPRDSPRSASLRGPEHGNGDAFHGHQGEKSNHRWWTRPNSRWPSRSFCHSLSRYFRFPNTAVVFPGAERANTDPPLPVFHLTR